MVRPVNSSVACLAIQSAPSLESYRGEIIFQPMHVDGPRITVID
jgi:hypothetical protein